MTAFYSAHLFVQFVKIVKILIIYRQLQLLYDLFKLFVPCLLSLHISWLLVYFFQHGLACH